MTNSENRGFAILMYLRRLTNVFVESKERATEFKHSDILWYIYDPHRQSCCC